MDAQRLAFQRARHECEEGEWPKNGRKQASSDLFFVAWYRADDSFMTMFCDQLIVFRVRGI